jgi:glycosyltransferase involved in cell wall biosynthesis
MPKVSICIPCYNNADEVERLLKSICGQDYKDYEVNISDDSTDSQTEIIAEKYQGLIENLNYIHNKKPYGHIYNWNVAIKMSKGEYIKIMFSDDWFTDSKSLGEFVGLLDNNPSAEFVFSGSRQVMLDGQNITNMQHVTGEHRVSSYDRYAPEAYIRGIKRDYRLFFCSNQIGAPSAVMYRRGDNLTLFDEKSNWASDMFLYFDLFVKSRDFSQSFAYTTKPLVSIGVHEHQYTESFSEKDMRIYNDYKYMYTKYNLRESRECKEYFTGNFIVKYNQGFKEAKSLGIGTGLYLKKYTAGFIESAKCFVKCRIKIWHKG